MQMRHSTNWSDKIHTEKWFCHTNHLEPLEFDEKIAFANHLKTEHGDQLTQSQLQGRMRRNRRIATRDSFVCPLCDCVPKDIEMRVGEKPYKLLWLHIAEHLKSLAFLSLSYVENNLEDRASVPNSSKGRDQDSSRISGESLTKRNLESFDDIPSTKVHSGFVEVEEETFMESTEGSFLGEVENWDFFPVKALETDYKHLQKHLKSTPVSLESETGQHSKRDGADVSSTETLTEVSTTTNISERAVTPKTLVAVDFGRS